MGGTDGRANFGLPFFALTRRSFFFGRIRVDGEHRRVLGRLKIATQIENTDHLLTIDELAYLLQLSAKTLYAKVKAGTIPVSRLSGSLRGGVNSYLQAEARGGIMAYVIAAPCVGVKDTACVDVCPVDCIHPRRAPQIDSVRGLFRSLRVEMARWKHSQPSRLH